MKYQVGDIFPNLTLTTVRGKSLNVPDAAHRYTHVQFRRWSGCPICNLHIASLRRSAVRIRNAGIREVLFFHSPARDVAPYQKTLPFDMIADPNKVHYKQLGVRSSIRSLLSLKAIWAALRGVPSGNFDLKMAGGPFGLPADFLVGPDGCILAVKYGEHAYDQWSVDEILALTHSAPALAQTTPVQGISANQHVKSAQAATDLIAVTH